MEVSSPPAAFNELQTAPSPGFLRLPGEIRNKIYYYIVAQTEFISIRDRTVYQSSPLSLVCRTLRSEFKDIWFSEAVKQAVRVHVHVSDLDMESVKKSVEYVMSTTSPPLVREQKLHFHLTNRWNSRDIFDIFRTDNYKNRYPVHDFSEADRSFDPGPSPWYYYFRRFMKDSDIERHYAQHGYPYTIHFDPYTFNVERCRQTVRKELGSFLTRTASYGRESLELEFAFDNAFAGYDVFVAQQAGVKRKRTVEMRAVEKRMRGEKPWDARG